MADGKMVAGVIVKEQPNQFQVMTNLLTPDILTRLPKKDIDEMIESKISPMPQGLLNVLTKEEILDLLAFLEAGGYHLPSHLEHKHNH